MKSKLLYYLDDDIEDLKYFQHVTTELGHRTEIFLTANELLYALKHQSETPDMIFLDVHMPILNGEEILCILKKSEFQSIPITMFSGAFPRKLVRDYQKNGADHLVKKSIGTDLKTALRNLIEISFPLTA